MRKILHNVVEGIRSRRQGRTTTEYEILWDNDTVLVNWLTLENETGSVSFLWDSILVVETFKRDQFMVDCICLAFEIQEGWIEVHENMKGWANFLEALEQRLSGFPKKENWMRKVAFPPFVTNQTRLWAAFADNKAEVSF